MEDLGQIKRLGFLPPRGISDGGSILAGQIGWWAARLGDDSRVANWANSQSNYVGTLQSGATWTHGRFGQMLQFDGTASGYVDLGTTQMIDMASPFTLLWVSRVDASPPAAPGLFVFNPIGTTQKFIVLRTDSGSYSNMSCGLANSGASAITHFSTPTLASEVGTGEHVYIITGPAINSYANSSFNAYVDGTKYVPGAAATLSSFTGTTNYIGWDSVDNNWKGALGCVRLWNRQLTAAEVNFASFNPYAGYDAWRHIELFRSSGVVAGDLNRMFLAM